MYNPLYHKNPVGAVASGEVFEIVFPVPSGWGAYGAAFIVLYPGGGESKFPLTLLKEADGEKFFGGSAVVNGEGIYQYRFEAYADYGVLFFGRGVDGTAVKGNFLPMWQLTVTKRGFKTPDFAKGGVIYHIFADRFNRGDKADCKDGKPDCNDDRADCKDGNAKFNGGNKADFKKEGVFHKDWKESPVVAEPDEVYLANDFFGGNFAGIIEKLDYLRSLSTDVIYLSPIFESFSNHRYDTGDYLKIDALLGDEADFALLIDEAKKRGMEIMLDGVFNHTGSDSLYFNKRGTYPSLGAYQSPESPYADWYYFEKFPDDYKCWWGITVVPTVNKDAPGYRELIFGTGGVIDKWMRAGVKGWRLDVADELPEDFVFELRREIKKRDRDCLIIGEVWEDASVKISYGTMRPYLLGAQLDGVMNYPFREAVLRYAAGGAAYDFVCAVTPVAEHYPKHCLDASMTLIGTHDTVRALTALAGVSGENMSKRQKSRFKLSESRYKLGIKRLKLATVLQYTLPGIPSIYYGDEAGVQGFEDPMNRVPYPWGGEDAELIDFYRALGKLRTGNKRIFSGGLRFIRTDLHGVDFPGRDGAARVIYGGAGTHVFAGTASLNTPGLNVALAFERYSESGSIAVYANSSDTTVSVYLPDCVNALTGEKISAGAAPLPPYGFVIVSV
ncbi:MAG: glycoside hydrolase family 13 protein [Clostridiaceae bacterium]|jgi:glycosidase|nr:glycoside hydrolase family 13 protein [Clostridiaceae bacterium]